MALCFVIVLLLARSLPATHPMLDARYWILDPPAHPNLPADEADNADLNRKDICVNLRDLREDN
jgi:hypothetical protein